jgi:hypothetical protein
MLLGEREWSFKGTKSSYIHVFVYVFSFRRCGSSVGNGSTAFGKLQLTLILFLLIVRAPHREGFAFSLFVSTSFSLASYIKDVKTWLVNCTYFYHHLIALVYFSRMLLRNEPMGTDLKIS